MYFSDLFFCIFFLHYEVDLALLTSAQSCLAKNRVLRYVSPLVSNTGQTSGALNL